MNSRKAFLAIAALLFATVFAACSAASTDTQANRGNGSLSNSMGNQAHSNGGSH